MPRYSRTSQIMSAIDTNFKLVHTLVDKINSYDTERLSSGHPDAHLGVTYVPYVAYLAPLLTLQKSE